MTALDASALLALLFREPGMERVVAAMKAACLSTVNLAEVLERLARDGFDSEEALEHLRNWPIKWVEFSAEQARIAAELAPAARKLGLSPADRACLALARDRGIPALTTDRAWARLRAGVEVQLLR